MRRLRPSSPASFARPPQKRRQHNMTRSPANEEQQRTACWAPACRALHSYPHKQAPTCGSSATSRAALQIEVWKRTACCRISCRALQSCRKSTAALGRSRGALRKQASRMVRSAGGRGRWGTSSGGGWPLTCACTRTIVEALNCLSHHQDDRFRLLTI